MTFYDENTHKIKNKEFRQLDKKYLLKKEIQINHPNRKERGKTICIHG